MYGSEPQTPSLPEAERPGRRTTAAALALIGLTPLGCGEVRDGVASESRATPVVESATAGDEAGSEGATSTGARDEGDDDGPPRLDVEEPDDGGGPPCVEGGGGGTGYEFSIIWIANSRQGTVSKIDTVDGLELGRYFTSPAELQGNPSRTTVNLVGDVAVSTRVPGTVTKIASQEDRCVDRNGDGVIQTSTGAEDILPWGSDECVLWHHEVPSPTYESGPRATAWEGKIDQTTCAIGENPRLWVGYRDERKHGVVLRFDGATGEVLDTVDLGPYGGDADNGYAPYGGAVNAEGDFILTGLGPAAALHIDADTLAITDLGEPDGSGSSYGVAKYGMGLDQRGNLWVGSFGGDGMYHYDFSSQTWVTIGDLGGRRVNGVQVDRRGSVWGAGSDDCRLVEVDVDTQTVIRNDIELPGCQQPWGVSIDVEGFVWVVDQLSSVAYKVNPDTYQTEIIVDDLVIPYTYSDMTGAGLNLVVRPPEG